MRHELTDHERAAIKAILPNTPRDMLRGESGSRTRGRNGACSRFLRRRTYALIGTCPLLRRLLQAIEYKEEIIAEK